MMRKSCPVCDRESPSIFFEAPDVPVHCNLLAPTREAALRAPRGDIRLAFCDGCGMIFNCAFDPALVSYTEGYETSLHFSPRFQKYAEELAARLVDNFDLRGKKVIEIGCGSGEFLGLLCAAGGNRGVGFDRSCSEKTDGEKDGSLTIVRDDYSEAYAHHVADLICCRHVLEHVPEPRAFLDQVRRAASKSGNPGFYFEVPDGLWTLRDLGIWDIIYEHCSYFTAPSLVALFRLTGFDPENVSTAFGNQFLCMEASVHRSSRNVRLHVEVTLKQVCELVAAFREHYAARVRSWNERLGKLLDTGKRVAVWGAGSKGVTFVNTLKDGAQIPTVIDVNPRKQGQYVPGTGQQVRSPRILSTDPVHAVIVMNPNYTAEIRAECSELGTSPELLAV